jgi:hypothetical protein
MLSYAAAPAIVRASTLMRIKPLVVLPTEAELMSILPMPERSITQSSFPKALWPGIQVWWDEYYTSPLVWVPVISGIPKAGNET